MFLDRSRNPLRVAMNSICINLDSINEQEKVFLESLISVVPKNKYLLLTYHKKDALVDHVALYGPESDILSASTDILSYCVLRMRTESSSLYSQIYY